MKLLKKTFYFLYLKITYRKLKQFGSNCYIFPPVKIFGQEFVEIGDDVSISCFVHIWGNGGIKIGNRVMIASNVSITSLTHNYNATSMRFSPIIAKRIIIEDDVWIGANAVILPGITIGKGAVVGAGSIVTKNVPANSIVVGNPAKVIKYRNLSKE